MSRRQIAAALLPVMVVVAAPAAAEDHIETIAGSVTAFSASRHEVAIRDESGTDRRFAWSKDTKFSGVVMEGARVSIRYARAAAGRPAEALSISVLK